MKLGKTTSDAGTVAALPQPKPKPKPRPASALEPSIAGQDQRPSPTSIELPQVPPRVSGSPNRNLLPSQSPAEESTYSPRNCGVKVFPDNALQELFQARLNRASGAPAVASRSNPLKRDVVPSVHGQSVPEGAEAEKRLSSSQGMSKPPPPPRPPAITSPAPPPRSTAPASAAGKDPTAGHNLSGLNDSLLKLNSSQILQDPTPPPRRPPHSIGIEDEGEDSDNLEENMELFEDQNKRGPGARLKSTSSFNSTSSSESESESDEPQLGQPIKFIPAAAASAVEVPGGIPMRRAISDPVILEDGDENADRLSIVSFRENKGQAAPRPRSGNPLSRWKNVESLELHRLQEEEGNGAKPRKPIRQEDERRRLETETSVQSNIPNKPNQLSLMTFTNDKKLDTGELLTKKTEREGKGRGSGGLTFYTQKVSN